MLQKLRYEFYRFKYRHATILNLQKPIDVSLELSSYCTNSCNYCYHAASKDLPFKRGFMSFDTAAKILKDAAKVGVNSVKLNYRGESTMNPYFKAIALLAKSYANGSTFIDRLTNSNFNFQIDRNDIFEGLSAQTKVKVSFDSFRKEIFEKQRKGSSYEKTIANIDKFYNWAGRDNKLVIQSVRTSLNADEDLAYEIKKRWPSATASIRDVVEGRVNKDLSNIVLKKRDTENRQSCLQAHSRLMINWDGKVQVCCPDIKSQLIIGDATKQSISEIWNCEDAKKIRRQLLDKSAFEFDPCKTCSSFESYRGYEAPWYS